MEFMSNLYKRVLDSVLVTDKRLKKAKHRLALKRAKETPYTVVKTTKTNEAVEDYKSLKENMSGGLSFTNPHFAYQQVRAQQKNIARTDQ